MASRNRSFWLARWPNIFGHPTGQNEQADCQLPLFRRRNAAINNQTVNTTSSGRTQASNCAKSVHFEETWQSRSYFGLQNFAKWLNFGYLHSANMRLLFWLPIVPGAVVSWPGVNRDGPGTSHINTYHAYHVLK
jgi:hypothetical protein